MYNRAQRANNIWYAYIHLVKFLYNIKEIYAFVGINCYHFLLTKKSRGCLEVSL